MDSLRSRCLTMAWPSLVRTLMPLSVATVTLTTSDVVWSCLERTDLNHLWTLWCQIWTCPKIVLDQLQTFQLNRRCSIASPPSRSLTSREVCVNYDWACSVIWGGQNCGNSCRFVYLIVCAYVTYCVHMLLLCFSSGYISACSWCQSLAVVVVAISCFIQLQVILQ